MPQEQISQENSRPTDSDTAPFSSTHKHQVDWQRTRSQSRSSIHVR